jgi:hypothetical protein
MGAVLENAPKAESPAIKDEVVIGTRPKGL